MYASGEEGQTHHAWLHRPGRLVLRVVRDVGVPVEELVDTVCDDGSHDGVPVRSCDGFTTMVVIRGTEESRNNQTNMTLPISRKSAPGLQILIASSRHLRVVRMSFFDSSSISPTGYVALRSE